MTCATQVSPQKDFDVRGPSRAAFMLGWRCNARCVMCTRYIEGVGYDALRVELDPNHVELITNRYRQTLKNVDIISYGEPLVHPKFSEIVEIIARNISHNPGYTITLVTNGSNLHEHQGILKHPGTLAFSIDAPDKPLYEKIRKGLSYDRLIENIYLAAAAQAILPGRRLAINMVIFEWTVNRIYAMAAFAKNMGIETLALLLGGCSEQSEFVRDQAVARGDPRVLEQVAMARRDFPGVCIIDYVTDPRGPVGHCRRPWSEIVVTNDGRVLPCCVMKTAPFGTCADPADWTGPKWNRLRDELYTRNILSSEFQTCKTCVWL